MIPRYTRPQMGRIWTEENKLGKWLEVELATCEALGDCGQIPKEAATTLRAKAEVPSPQRVAEIEKEVRHDVIAFTLAVTEKLGPAGRYLHFGLTSYDVVDTAQALLVADASDLLLSDLARLADALKRRAYEFKDTVVVGRTHGVHAEPTTFGLKLANWYSESERNRARLARAAEEMRVGKLSGAVGTFAHLAPDIEQRICQRLGLKPAAISSQIIQRDRYAYYLATLAVIATSLDNIALEIRHLQRTEVREVEEAFGTGQRGSSAMPHKRNPVTAEQICGLARLVRANAQAALENVPLWHERDISHSSVERIILPDSTILVDYLLDKTTELIAHLRVYPERMRENLELTRGLIYSGQLLLDLAAKGVGREQAYAWVQEDAMQVWEGKQDFKQVVLGDKRITGVLSKAEIEAAFDLRRQLRHVDAIFARVFSH
ncbi:MAG: adenylosuccinate lyase [Terriglobia bacterium]